MSRVTSETKETKDAGEMTNYVFYRFPDKSNKIAGKCNIQATDEFDCLRRVKEHDVLSKLVTETIVKHMKFYGGIDIKLDENLLWKGESLLGTLLYNNGCDIGGRIVLRCEDSNKGVYQNNIIGI